MGSLFRSEEMSLMQIIVQSDTAYEVVGELGELSIAQFRDLNPETSAFQRRYVNDVRRCDEMERKIRFFESQMAVAGIPYDHAEAIDSALEDGSKLVAHPSPQQMDELEQRFIQLDKELKEINSNEEMLHRNFFELTELAHILRSTQEFFDEAQSHQFGADDYASGSGSGSGSGSQRHETTALLQDPESAAGSAYGAVVRVGFVAGAIASDRLPAFERVLWRVTRGNAFLRSAPISESVRDPTTNESASKAVFLVFFQGDQLEARVRKISEGFGATLYPCPQTATERRDLGLQVFQRLQDLDAVLKKTRDHRRRVLNTVATQMGSWNVQVKKIKGIFHILNMFSVDASQKVLVAEAWVANCFLPDFRDALTRAAARSYSAIPPIAHVLSTRLKRPTFHRVNKFTAGFQAIIDSYGVGSYREVNPAPFAIITFPFLFAVMFGDFGHGFIMFLAALFLVRNEKQLAKFKAGGEIFNTMFGGRYIILLMGLFSVYTGLVYNDIFSRSVDFFGTGWDIPLVTKNVTGNFTGYAGLWNDTFYPGTNENNSLPEMLDFDPVDVSHTYVFGIDPVWAMSENMLTFLNPYKMKMSVILGVIQLMFGIVLSLFNHLHFKRYINIWCEFIPQVLFLACIFGYLVFMIFFKWANFWPHSKAPSLLITLINMFLKFGNIAEEDRLYSGIDQATLQSALVVIALLCVPWMLIPKPVIMIMRNRKAHGHALPFSGSNNRRFSVSSHADDDPLLHEGSGVDGSAAVDIHDPASVHAAQKGLAPAAGTSSNPAEEEEEESHEAGEIVVHQCIHTIEFCLGCISNTASYLRLWALSLAHAQLSEVLWSMILNAGLSGNVVLLFGAWGAWAVLTVAVLIIMEGLSAFLHALRLHWVEFNGKFYQGTGIKFKPFSFSAILQGGDQED